MKRRAVVLVGAGASVEYGIPATAKLTKNIDEYINRELETGESTDAFSLETIECYSYIKKCLKDYLVSADEVHFERIYHAINLIEQSLPPKADVLPNFKPIISSFIDLKYRYSQHNLWHCSDLIVRAIYHEVKTACEKLLDSELITMNKFIKSISSNYITRIYTTNYDDFIDRAVNFEWISGFCHMEDVSYFNPSVCWNATDENCVYHLHGSVHFGFYKPLKIGQPMEIVYFKNIEKAFDSIKKNHVSSGVKMDGCKLEKAPIITGLSKLDKIQQSPFSHYYACFSKDIIHADIIFILGSGLSDLHINSWVSEARKLNPSIKIVIVDYFPDESDFIRFMSSNDFKKKTINVEFECEFFNFNESNCNYQGWTFDKSKNAAIWATGFKKFLDHWNDQWDFIR